MLSEKKSVILFHISYGNMDLFTLRPVKIG